MSLPSVKALDSHDGQAQESNNTVNNNNPTSNLNGTSTDQTNQLGAASQSQTANGQNRVVSGSQLGAAQQQQQAGQPGIDDPYRYGQQQQGPPQQGPPQQGPPQQQQYAAYYSYQPVYSQQQHQNQYPYYQAGASQVASVQGSQLNNPGSYPNYSDYSRVGYVQNFAPPYQNPNGAPQPGSNTGTPSSIPGSVPQTASQIPAPQVTNPAGSAVGQVQPVGSRPRVTTTMWEDEKTLCYQVDANGVSVVRRADNDMINGTKLLNVAHMTRGRRDGILKSEKVRDVVKIGSMHLKGVWIPFDRALAMAQREGIVDLLYPLFVRDIKQVIQQGSTTQPQANPAAQWGYAQQPQQPIGYPQAQAPLPPQAQAQQPPAQSNQQQGAVDQKPNTSASSSSLGQASAQAPQPSTQPSYAAQQGAASQQQQQQYQQQQQQQQQQQGYYGSQFPYYPQYQYAYNTSGSSGAATQSAASQSQGNASQSGQTTASSYQYPQYSYGYLPQYQNPQYDDKEK